MPSVKEIFGRITQLQQEEAAWVFVQGVLNEYLASDAAPAMKTIAVPDSTVAEVSQEVLIEILGRIADGHLEPIRKRLRDLEGVQVDL